MIDYHRMMEDFLGDLYHHGLCGVVIGDTNLP